jgi:hypothetical protein
MENNMLSGTIPAEVCQNSTGSLKGLTVDCLGAPNRPSPPLVLCECCTRCAFRQARCQFDDYLHVVCLPYWLERRNLQENAYIIGTFISCSYQIQLLIVYNLKVMALNHHLIFLHLQ